MLGVDRNILKNTLNFIFVVLLCTLDLIFEPLCQSVSSNPPCFGKNLLFKKRFISRIVILKRR